jgi:Mg2+-importing ATPase
VHTLQLLPAVVSTSLAAGSRQLSRRKVLVKRLGCIEGLGDVDLLFTDKTGTLTVGTIEYARAVPATGERSEGVLPFDHDRRMVSVVVRDPAGAMVLVTNGAPEPVLERRSAGHQA